jgi:hypothetical protein
MSLIKDFTPLQQPDNSWPFALNVIQSTEENQLTSVSSEPGNRLIVSLRNNFEIIGEIYFDNKVIVFSTDNTTSEIGLLENDRYTRLYEGTLNFSKDHNILGQHRILAGCDDVFYFMDGINPDRYFNLNEIPSTDEEFNILRNALEPTINVTINNTGGRMPSSAVSFQLQYINLQGDVFDVSEPTVGLPVYNDTISSTAQGSTTVTNKSATLSITNIDTRFPYVRLVAIHNVEGNYEAYQIDNIITIDESLEIIYPGPTENDIRIDNREIQVGKSIYNTSLVSEQVLGRLLRANVQEITQDYSTHQRLVNQIVTEAVQVAVSKDNFSQDPEFYKNNMTFQSDEVYAIGIRFTDSTNILPATPVYHVPGRAALDTELDEVTYNEETYLRFQIENTADLGPDTNSMGYYQSTSNYPDITDCNGEAIYGDLAGTPVRHHRIPSRRNVPLEIGNEIFLIHLNFSNIQYPEGYDGYEMFYVERTDNNSTVLDSGFLNSTTLENVQNSAELNYVHFGGFDTSGGLTNVGAFLSPRSLLEDNIRGNYFDVQKSYIINPDNNTFNREQRSGVGNLNVDLLFDTQEILLQSFVNEFRFYNRNAYVQPESTDNTVFDLPVYNFSNSNTLNVYGFPENLPVKLAYAVNKRILSPYANIQSLIYKPLIKVGDNWQGDAFVHKFSFLSIRGPFSDYINNLYVESKINFNLVGGERFVDGDDINYVVSKFTANSDIIEREEYNENLAYRYNSIKSYFPLPLTYDYCNRCRSSNPTRIIFSPQSFQEELADSYLINNVNDFIDLPADTGPITGLKYKGNRLYVHTTQTTYVLTPNPQFINTNNEVAQLSSGDFLSIPPQEIMDSDYGYGGLQDKMGTIDTEYSYFWVDGLRGTVNSINQNFREISKTGMISFFKNKLEVDSQIRMAYDAYYSRILITIRNATNCQPFHTISYNLMKEGFTSFHSYYPKIYLTTPQAFYSTNNNKIYKHLRSERFANYYNTKRPVIIEQVDTKFQTSNLINITHYTEFFEGTNEVEDVFSYLTVYNSNQSSGKLKLFKSGPYTNYNLPPDTKSVKIVDKNHHIANIWDNSTSDIISQFPCNTPEYSDKDFINTDIRTVTHYNRPLFREKYTIARFEYNPTEDRRMTHYITQQNKQLSVR